MPTYKCNNCGEVFDEPHEYVETHGFTTGPFEHFHCCPFCGDNDFEEVEPE